MGNTCNFLESDPSNENKYLDQDDKDEPNSSYAIEILDPKQLPSDMNHLRSLFDNEKISEPSWYKAGESVKIDSLFFVKRYELYYRGEWKRGVPHGFGEVMTKDGQYFKGYFKEGIARGPKCLFVISPQTYYLGAVERNQRNGHGRFVDGKYSYQGQWFDNFPTGQGKEILMNGDEYEGDFLQGKRDGEGRYYWKTGEFESYSGKFIKNEMSGYGILKARDGRVWKGQFCCSKDFIIDNAECRSQTKVFRGVLRNLAPEKEFTIIMSKDEKQIFVEQKYQLSNKNGKMNGRGLTTKPFKVFEDKILIHYDQSASTDELQKILKIIQSNYSDSKKHSKALQAIIYDLPGYLCSFWSEQEAIDGMVIAPICGRYVKVARRIQH